VIAGLFWLAVSNGCIFLAAHAIWRRIRCDDPAVDPVLFLLVRLILISATILIAGTAGFLGALPLGIAAAVVLAGLLAAGEHRHVRPPSRLEIGRMTAILAALIAGRMLIQVWIYAPFSGDGLSYHLPKIGEWIRAGRFTREMGLESPAAFPAGFELIETWWVVFLHHDLLIELGGVEFSLLAFAAVRALSLKLGHSPRTAALAATLYLLTPLFTLQVTSCLNDAPVAALYLAGAALAFGRPHPSLLVLPIALVAGVKGTGLYALPGIAVLLALRMREPMLRPGSLRWSLPLAVASAGVGSYWYLRNWFWFGNPIHPITRAGLDMDGIHIQAGPSLSSLRLNLADLVSNLVYDGGEYRVNSLRMASWGILTFSFGILCLIQGLREDRGLRILGLGFGVSLLSVLTFVSHDGWYSRFILFFPAITCLAAARLAFSSVPIGWGVALAAMFQFGSTMVAADLPIADIARLQGQSWRERSTAPLHGAQDLPIGEPVAVYATRRTRTFMLYGADFARKVVYLRVRNAEEMREEMARQGIKYVYVNVESSFARKAGIQALVDASELAMISPRLYRLQR
jgi:hypothetical protein